MPHRLLLKSLTWLGMIILLGLNASAAQTRSSAQRWPHDAPVREGLVVASGEHFVVHLQFKNELAGKRAMRAVDLAWPEAMKFLGTPEHNFDSLLEIHLYDSKDRYVEVDRWLTGGNFKFNESFSHWNSLSAHVVMAPPLTEIASKRFGLTSQTLEVLVHEAAHLATYTVVPTYRYHPTWFSEGLAMHVEQATLRKLGLLKDPADHPRYASQQLAAKALLDQGRVPNVLDILVDELGDLRFHERYALWSDFMKVLTAKPKLFATCVRDLRNMRGGPKMRARISQSVIEQYGAPYLERALRRELAYAPAHWDETSRSLETIGDDWEQVAFEGIPARAWNLVPLESESFDIRGSLELLGKEASMQVLLDRQATGHLAVEFKHGSAALLSEGEEGKKVLASAQAPSLEHDAVVPFLVSIKAGQLSVTVNGTELLKLPIERKLNGAWGLGVGRSGAGIWHNVRVLAQ